MIDFDKAQEEAAEPKFGVRPFRAKDIAPMVRIVSKIGVKEFAGVISPGSISALMAKTDDGDEQVNVVGVGVVLEVVGIVCENFDRAESDIFSFMSSLTGMTRAEVEDLSLADTFDVLYAIFTAKDFSDFFKRARALLAK